MINFKKNKMARKELEKFQDILFHYNPYEDKWFAFKRDDANDYFSNRENIKLLSGSSISAIVSALNSGRDIE